MSDSLVTGAKPGLESVTISSDEFFRRARELFTFDVPPALTDATIIPDSDDPGMKSVLEIIAREQPIRPAAVLVPVIEREEPMVLLTQRSAHLSDHAGQVAFPGGKIDPTDSSPVHAALREAEEEVGLDADFVEPIGYLDLYGTPFGFRILPTLARVSTGFELRVNKGEVDDVFEVPLAFLMNPANHFLKSREFRDITPVSYTHLTLPTNREV